jgi:hypothetical protein
MPNQNGLIINWLLENDNPAVKHRTLTELLGKSKTDSEVVRIRERVLNTLPQATGKTWMMDLKGLWLTYNLLALAECGLTKEDIDVSVVFTQWPEKPNKGGFSGFQYSGQFDAACGEALLLRALVALGYKDNKRVQDWLNAFSECILPDGGFLCLHWRPRFKYTPKSCMKDNMHVLLMLAECKKQGLEFEYTARFLDYFMKRRVFYRSNSLDILVLRDRPGKRMIDNFFPAEPFRVGLPHLLYAFSVLGAGNKPELKEAWELMQSKKDREGKSLLEGTLAKSYLPKERVGKPSKWVTLYAMLAEKYREVGE